MKKITLLTSALTFALASVGASAKISSQEATKLTGELTPMGAVRAANADGSIPAWNGGITTPPAGYKEGMHHPDPFSADKVLYTVTNANKAQYKDLLTPGVSKMLATYPDTYKLDVYQSRRTASYPKYVYDATVANATKTELVQNGNGIKNAAIGVPFPVPANGLEVIWNHILRFRGASAIRHGGQAVPTADGDYTYIGFDESIAIDYSKKDATAAALEESNILFRFKQKITEPARLAGTALLVHETMDQVKQPRQAWTYNSGQRRVRRAPNVAYDAPGSAADGLRTTDDFDMYNGAPDRYTWTLKGKKEVLIPYNSYKLHSNSLQYDDIIKPGHIATDVVRWEKHRVWVVEANLKDGISHVYKKRVFYIDEDSWQVSIADMYDNRDELYRVAVAYGINYYEVPTHWSTLEVYYDLDSRRYIAIGLDNQEDMYDFKTEQTDRMYTPAALRREGR
ncbi:hypothetical protein GCM10008107_03920 [Psychrosphaera saromensis]|uniref:Outer membrane lipoprotein-sorting protein n=1 Tax=Psychrosphaera saromensis TaxID=716813 RepID=A0A2S7UXD9_9GAMM|nr:DUF1329 domain-containing protein [Psychrosphaera saromensis]PQJ54664.1 outer membrane lipoprotein-sorting protein [Psychrosphaera saromensis]GHB58182.1 hypothetical protein GCM10008107_03920 [Psychrosphaera saromensis]